MEETMSITIVEGMMCGKACITTDATGVAEYIVNGKNGLICNVGDVNDLKDKMSYLINNSDKRLQMGIEARQTYENYFTLEKFGERLEDEIDCVLKDYKRRFHEENI
jgi:glycosyltransferase involved in cell wall biosynthesis